MAFKLSIGAALTKAVNFVARQQQRFDVKTIIVEREVHTGAVPPAVAGSFDGKCARLLYIFEIKGINRKTGGLPLRQI